MINLAIMLLLLSFVFEGYIETSSDGMNSSKGWETGCLLGGVMIWGVGVGVDCLAPFLVGMFMSLQWGMLFVKVSKDR
jgi:hypothetical protein